MGNIIRSLIAGVSSGLIVYFFEMGLDNYLFYVTMLGNALFWGFLPEVMDTFKKACIGAGSIFK